ncbi:hypothetical protein FLA_5147 [Filimonas lacunae]|nr:hypothetical protein FLA_5147 [Filimonas lacunae]
MAAESCAKTFFFAGKNIIFITDHVKSSPCGIYPSRLLYKWSCL